MSLSGRYILPHIIDMGCGSKSVQLQRGKVVSLALAEGWVLEVGISSGLNMPFYNTKKIAYLIGSPYS